MDEEMNKFQNKLINVQSKRKFASNMSDILHKKNHLLKYNKNLVHDDIPILKMEWLSFNWLKKEYKGIWSGKNEK